MGTAHQLCPEHTPQGCQKGPLGVTNLHNGCILLAATPVLKPMRESTLLAEILVLQNYGMEGFSTFSPDHIQNSELRIAMIWEQFAWDLQRRGPEHVHVPVSHLINSIILFHSVRRYSSNKFVQEEYWEIALHHAKEWEPRVRDWTAHHPESLHAWALPLPGDVCNYRAAWERSLTETHK